MADSEPEQSGKGSAAEAAGERKTHWYQRITPGARMLFWSIYFGIFVVAAVTGIGIALAESLLSPNHLMRNPITSLVILVTGTVGEMFCLHRGLGIYMLRRRGKEAARLAVYIAGAALSLSFLLAVAIVVLYVVQ
ncbi:MAG: hypothetical protein ACREJ2_09605 [Planctomycetota bacterium]